MAGWLRNPDIPIAISFFVTVAVTSSDTLLKASIPESQRFDPKSEHCACSTLFVKWINELTQPNQDAGEKWMNSLGRASVVPLLGFSSGIDWLSKMWGFAELLLLWFSPGGRDRTGKGWCLEKAALKEKDLVDKESFGEMPGMSSFLIKWAPSLLCPTTSPPSSY